MAGYTQGKIQAKMEQAKIEKAKEQEWAQMKIDLKKKLTELPVLQMPPTAENVKAIQWFITGAAQIGKFEAVGKKEMRDAWKSAEAPGQDRENFWVYIRDEFFPELQVDELLDVYTWSPGKELPWIRATTASKYRKVSEYIEEVEKQKLQEMVQFKIEQKVEELTSKEEVEEDQGSLQELQELAMQEEEEQELALQELALEEEEEEEEQELEVDDVQLMHEMEHAAELNGLAEDAESPSD